VTTAAPDPWLAQQMHHRVLIARAENTLAPAVQAAVREYLRAVATGVLGVTHPTFAARRPDLNAFPDASHWTRIVHARIVPTARSIFEDSFARLATASTRLAHAATDYAAALPARLAAFPRNVYSRMRTAVAESLARAETPEELHDRLMDLLHPDQWTGQADTITRTETMCAVNAGALAGALDEAARTGQHWQKRWLRTRDDKVRHTHQDANGQVRDLHDPFMVGGHRLQFPGDPTGPPEEIINCRCSVQYGPGLSLTAAAQEDPMTTATAPATGPDTAVTVTPNGRWRGVLGLMNAWSADQRMLQAPDADAPVRARPLPLPLLVQPELAPGHEGAKLGVGVIDRVWTEGEWVMGEGRFDMDDPLGVELARKVGSGFIRFVSLDVDDATAQQVCLAPDGETMLPDCDPTDMSVLLGQVYTGWRVMGATLLAHPAFPDAHIALAGDTTEQAAHDVQAAVQLAADPVAPTDATTPAGGDTGTAPLPAGYDPAWGCVVPDGNGNWTPADSCGDPDAVPADADGTAPYVAQAATEGPTDPAEQVTDTGTGCVIPDPDNQGQWISGDCDADGAVPANATGDAPAPEVTDAANAAATMAGDGGIPIGEGGDAQDTTAPAADQGNGCVCPDTTADSGWAPCECTADGATPSDTDGNPIESGDDSATLATTPPTDCAPCRAVAITASATVAEPTTAPGWTPLADWFTEPDLTTGPRPITMDPSTGRLSGLLAQWGTCHVGFRDRCITPPRSATDYAYYNIRPVHTDQGTIYCGLITMDTGHAPLDLTASSATAHYDNTGTQAAVVRIGENSHGIWAAGVCLPGLTENDRLKLSLSSFSGDWRQVRSGTELVAALAVNTPGFPLARVRTGADNRPYALVAAGAMPHTPAPPARQPLIDIDAVRAQVLAEVDARQAARDRLASAQSVIARLGNATRAARLAKATTKVRQVQGEFPPTGAIPRGDKEFAKNWVDQQGGLPPYIRRIAAHLQGKGMDTSQSIAVAVNVVKKMCSTGDTHWPGLQKVNATSQAQACKAVESWEAKKAAAHAD
jgi:hypothetical protein